MEEIDMLKKTVFVVICLVIMLASISTPVSAFENVPAPEKLTAELSTYSDGRPYFKIIFEIPASLKDLVNKEYEDDEPGAYYSVEFEYKIGEGSWQSDGNAFSSEFWQKTSLIPGYGVGWEHRHKSKYISY